MDTFIIYKTEVERQTGKLIKAIRSDRGGEFYGKFSEKGQSKGPFATYLEKCGIVAQYTTPYTPQQNGVSERRNRTLMSMVRSMIVRSGLPKFLWGEALKTANYICNRTPSKAVPKTPFEIWCGYRPSLNHMHVWGCKTEARINNGENGKLDSQSISSYFIGYCEKSKGYKFYCPGRGTRIIESHRATFYDELIQQDKVEDELPDVANSNASIEKWFVYTDIVPDIAESGSAMIDFLPENNEDQAQVENNADVEIENENAEDNLGQQEAIVLRRSTRERRCAI